MSIHNRYANVPLTEEDFTTFDAQFAIIEEMMGALPEPDRIILRRVAKLGYKSDTFTRDALMLAGQHEELLPRGLDVQELEAQIELRDALKARALHMKLMARKMEKIVQLLGSDIFSGALAAYKSMKANHRGMLNEQLRELGRIFRNRRKTPGEDEGPESQDERPETRDEGQRQHASAEQTVQEGASMTGSEQESSPGSGGSGATSMQEYLPGRSVQSVASDSPRNPLGADRLEHAQGTPHHPLNQNSQSVHKDGSESPELRSPRDHSPAATVSAG